MDNNAVIFDLLCGSKLSCKKTGEPANAYPQIEKGQCMSAVNSASRGMGVRTQKSRHRYSFAGLTCKLDLYVIIFRSRQ
jgi:hypothetical protein